MAMYSLVPRPSIMRREGLGTRLGYVYKVVLILVMSLNIIIVSQYYIISFFSSVGRGHDWQLSGERVAEATSETLSSLLSHWSVL